MAISSHSFSVASMPLDTPLILKWAAQKCRRFSRLAAQTTLLTLDGLFFAGKVSDRVPPLVTRTTLVALNGVWLISFPYSGDLFCKVIGDGCQAQRAKTYAITLLAYLKALEIFSGMGLVLLNLSAAVLGLFDQEALQSTLYNGMIPVGEATLLLTMSLTLAYMVLNYLTLKKLNKAKEGENPLEIATEALDFSENGPLAAQIRACMDKDTFYQLREQVALCASISQRGEILEVVRKNIETQQNINLSGQLALLLLGDLLMAVEKYYTPNSLVSATINLSVSSAYTVKILWETLREVTQRGELSYISASSSIHRESI